ncbi:MAG: hypothetical protein ABI623_01770 [bacterium]
MKTRVVLIAFIAMAIMGCSNHEKEEDLQKQLTEAQQKQNTLHQNIEERDKYMEDVIHSVNDVYADLAQARAKEAKLAKGTPSEGPIQFSNAQSRQQLLANISEIGIGLKENRKKVANLEVRIKFYRGDITGLNKLVENLKTSIAEREQSIAQLEARVQGLETTVAEKTAVITEKEGTIGQQQKQMNTAYYIVGTRDELKKKGIITDEGGFLWGLLGSTTVMASGIDQSSFIPIDKTTDQTIRVQGRVDEILPHRNESLFAMVQPGKDETEIAIVSPERFWQDRYLVIVLEG